MSKLIPQGTFTSVPLDLMDISPFYYMQINQPVLVAAMDTLALVQLGTAFKDPSILMQAKRSYGRSLRLLVHTVSMLQPGEESWDEQLVSAVLITALSGVRLPPFRPSAFGILPQSRHNLTAISQLLVSGPRRHGQGQRLS
jgi:hypothetical protein